MSRLKPCHIQEIIVLSFKHTRLISYFLPFLFSTGRLESADYWRNWLRDGPGRRSGYGKVACRGGDECDTSTALAIRSHGQFSVTLHWPVSTWFPVYAPGLRARPKPKNP